MKKYVRQLNFIPLLILLLFLASATTMAIDDDKFIIITGQVSNTEYGNPLDEHTVYIKSESVAFSSNFYFKVLETDEDGFFYDTISTSKDYGSLEIYTYDHSENKESETLHFRFMDFTNSNTFLVNFHIYMPLQTPVIQARYRFIKKTMGDKFRFKFVDETQNEGIVSWNWDFGDGITSNLPNPEHFFPDFGMYKVNLKILAVVNGNLVESQISKYVFIPPINYYHLGGHCFVDQFPIDNGYAFLYQVDDDDVLIPFDTAVLNDTLGQYYFYQVPEGRYCIKTQPGQLSMYYGERMPTYFGNSEYWKDAEVIEHNHTDFDYHVDLLESSGIPEGSGIISGKITFTSNDRDDNPYSTEGVSVYILDALNMPMGYQYTDKYGQFNFENMAMGTYWIYPELAGFDLNKESIELTDMIPEVQDVEILINTDAVYLIFPDREGLEDNFVGQPYPNPAADHITFEVNLNNSKDLKFELVDLQGKVLVSEILNLTGGFSKNKIETSAFEPGIYFLRLYANGITSERKIVINH